MLLSTAAIRSKRQLVERARDGRVDRLAMRAWAPRAAARPWPASRRWWCAPARSASATWSMGSARSCPTGRASGARTPAPWSCGPLAPRPTPAPLAADSAPQARSTWTMATAARAASAPLLLGPRRRARQGLRLVGHRQHAEAHRHARVERDPRQAGGGLAGDVLVVVGLAPDHRAQGHHRVEAAASAAAAWAASGSSKAPGHHPHRPRRSAAPRISARAAARARERGRPPPRALKRERTSATRSPRRVGTLRGGGLLHWPWNCAGRFSRKAVVPSFMSSVVQSRPKSVASRYCASSSGISRPAFTASRVKRSDDGRVGQHLPQQRLGLGQELVLGHHAVHEADPQGLRRRRPSRR